MFHNKLSFMKETQEPKILVIPDVHGRTFWKEAIVKFPDLETIFLGDYLDPYPDERITKYKAIENFKEILEFAKSNENWQLLLGNHDIDYILEVEGSRKDSINGCYIRQLFLEAIDLFNFATIREIDKKTYLFSHAPILKEWVEENKDSNNIEKIVDKLNLSLMNVKERRFSLLRYLYQISNFRGGSHKWGSPIWSDVRELYENKGTFLSGIDYNVFGHTQLSEAIIMQNYACLDTKNAYIITEKGEIESV